MKIKTVTIDFDGTLNLPLVQAYVKELIQKGVDVWVLTSRFDELHKHLYPKNPSNKDLYDVLLRLGIPKHKVIFTNMQLKSDFLRNTKVLFHLDDDKFELSVMRKECEEVKPVWVAAEDWKETCEKILSSEL